MEPPYGLVVVDDFERPEAPLADVEGLGRVGTTALTATQALHERVP